MSFDFFPNSWKLCPLEDVMDAIIDYRGKTPKKTESGVPLVTAKIVKDGYVQTPTEFIAEDSYETWMVRGLPEVGDVVLTTEAPLGEAAQLTNSNVALAQRIVTLRGKKGVLSNDYLLCVMQSNYVQHQLEARATGSTVKGIKQSELRKLILPVPPFEEQQRISNILKSFSDKILLNSKTNQTLEQIAQAIFKSWFVDFDPVKAKIEALAAGGSAEDAELAAMSVISAKTLDELNSLKASNPEAFNKLAQTTALFPAAMQDTELGEIPEGWETPIVRDVATTIKGKSYKSAELESSNTALVTLKSFNRGGGYRLDGLKEYTGKYKPEQEVFAGDLIVAYTDVTQAADVIGKPAMVISDARYNHLVISLDVAVVRPSNDNLKYYLYGVANTAEFQQHTQAHSTGTTVLHLSKNAVPDYKFTLAQEDLVNAYVEHAKPIFSKINEIIEENISLNALRDTLLPKLLSGEINVTSGVVE